MSLNAANDADKWISMATKTDYFKMSKLQLNNLLLMFIEARQ